MSADRSNAMHRSAQARGRLGSIELLRIVGAFGIVLFHLGGPGASIGYSALPMFIFLSLYFALGTDRELDLRSFALKRRNRLLLPWLFWSAVFAVLKIGDALAGGRPIASEFAWWNLATGPSIHLWFLPFIAALSLLLHAAWPLLQRANRTTLLLVLPGIGALVMLANDRLEMALPFPQWAFGAPAALMAISAVREGSLAPVRTVAVWGLGCAGLLALGINGGALQLLITALALRLALWVRLPLGPALRYAAGMSLGVYILHPVLWSIIRRFGATLLNGSFAAALLVFCASFAATAALRSTPVLRRVL